MEEDDDGTTGAGLSEESTVGTQLVYDDLPASALKAYLGTFLVDVRHLRPDLENNRQISKPHIDRLKLAFRTGLRRFDLNTRISALTSKPVVDELIQSARRGNM
jgi:hypothetical protein